MSQFTLIFTKEQLQVLNAALIEIPFRVAAPLIEQINQQIQAQLSNAPEQPEEKQA